jgi:hypothetical protein
MLLSDRMLTYADVCVGAAVAVGRGAGQPIITKGTEGAGEGGGDGGGVVGGFRESESVTAARERTSCTSGGADENSGGCEGGDIKDVAFVGSGFKVCAALAKMARRVEMPAMPAMSATCKAHRPLRPSLARISIFGLGKFSQ